MMVREAATGASASARFFRWLPALVLAQCALVAVLLLGALPTAGLADGQALPVALAAVGQGLLLLLRALPVLFLLSWPLLRLRNACVRWVAVGLLWSLFVLLQLVLDRYYLIAHTPLGADLFGYTRQEIATTVAGSSGLGGAALAAVAAPLLVLWCVLAWRARREPARRAGVALGLLALGILAWFVPTMAGTAALHSEGQRQLAANKLALFVSDTARWLGGRTPAAGALVAEADDPGLSADDSQEVAAPEAVDPAYPFARDERSADVLGPYFAPAVAGQAPPNLVVIIVEGLGRSFSGPDASLGSFTPFLDELAQRSLYFDNFLANQGRTFGVLPSLLGSLPSAEQGFTALGKDMPAHPGLFNVLARQGYDTAFYNGTDASFDNERGYMQLQQVGRIIDATNFGAGYARNPFSEWGYDDRELVSRLLADNDRLKAPFALAVQTISMHTPYRFPGQDAYRAKLAQRLEQLKVPEEKRGAYRASADAYTAVLHTDEQLRRYFDSARQQPWYANTIFVITGDHRLPEIPMGEHVDRYHVPLLIHSPLLARSARIGAVSSHLDVTPSLLALLSHHYGLQRPARVPWIGRGLDMATAFRNLHEIPLQQTKTSGLEFVSGRWWLRDGKLYELGEGLRLSDVSDPRLLAWVSNRLQRHLQANATLAQRKPLLPGDGRDPLVAYDPATAQPLRLAAKAPDRVQPGISVDGVRLTPSAGAIAVAAAFANGDADSSDTFVPLAVLTADDGRELAEAYGSAQRLAGHERRVQQLSLATAGLSPGRYFVTVRPSDPATGKPVGQGRFHLPVDVGAPAPEKASQ